MTSLNSCSFCFLEECLAMHCVDIGYCTENAKVQSFNFHSSKINFFENCDAHFIWGKNCFPKKFCILC